MRRLNVREAQIDACIRTSMFALHQRPTNPELQQGELLLLQLVSSDATSQRRTSERINFALIFDRIEDDHDGSISREHWPKEGRIWPWIVYGLGTVPTIPFSLSALSLSRDYSGQDNARYIQPSDELLIRPHILWSLAQSPETDRQAVPTQRIAEVFGNTRSLSAVFNHDRIEILNPGQVRKSSREEIMRNPALAEMLRTYYENQCQICNHSFEPVYGSGYSEAHHIQYVSLGGRDISSNMVVLCPNHHRIIHETRAEFDEPNLTYLYPNGLREQLSLDDHFVKSPFRGTAELRGTGRGDQHLIY